MVPPTPGWVHGPVGGLVRLFERRHALVEVGGEQLTGVHGVPFHFLFGSDGVLGSDGSSARGAARRAGTRRQLVRGGGPQVRRCRPGTRSVLPMRPRHDQRVPGPGKYRGYPSRCQERHLKSLAGKRLQEPFQAAEYDDGADVGGCLITQLRTNSLPLGHGSFFFWCDIPKLRPPRRCHR